MFWKFPTYDELEAATAGRYALRDQIIRRFWTWAAMTAWCVVLAGGYLIDYLAGPFSEITLYLAAALSIPLAIGINKLATLIAEAEAYLILKGSKDERKD